ncbi:MAG: CotH kinase family protein [Muribaculaceae bacterium]|nr:CotH kinase family protein [Muribaculaceae bacterium]
MKKILLLVILMATAMASQAKVSGDVDGNGSVDVADVNAVINAMLGKGSVIEADIDGNGVVDITDINQVVNIMLGKVVPEPVLTGYDYVWNPETLPEIHITVGVDEWNRLLQLYDQNSGTKQYVMADRFDFVGQADTTSIADIGLRLKGNTSRRRPEGSSGQMHQAGNTDWHHFHMGINLRKYYKDEEHTVQGVRKFVLKWFKDDPMYVRELFCYNLFAQAGVWTAPRSHYCRLWLKVAGDPAETYYGVYEMNEPIDENYLKQRDDSLHFGTHQGNLWKCKYVGRPATLTDPYNGDYWYDDDSDDNHTYTLQTNTKRFDDARAQLIDFQLKLNGKGRESFYTWINQVCDVDLLLRTYAVSVAVGMWDDYWNNANNYYLYFTTEDLYDYKVYLLPYDYDNTLGTSSQCGVQSDAGRQDPLHWGQDGNPLIRRLLEYDDFKAKYLSYLRELVDPESDLMHYLDAKDRIEAWHEMIAPHVSNDTGEDMEIQDLPAWWGNHSEYRLLDPNPDVNFFRVKAAAIANSR